MRAFFAVPVPDALRLRLGEVQATLAETLRGIRWVRGDSVHLTLVFLSEIDEACAEALGSAAARACSGIAPGAARVSGAGFFPARGNPRVLWIGVQETDGGVLRSLHLALAAAAADRGIPGDGRPFSPHLTLGRAKGRLSRRAVEAALESLGEVDLGEMPVDRCTLYRSILGPGGARYEARATVSLEVGE